ncbi:MAG TPA: hypothetical protein VFX76_19855 [Roseiflexaceae bacterium]|nr:hypothetical protein [Roseiflexaceae bacterium]
MLLLLASGVDREAVVEPLDEHALQACQRRFGKLGRVLQVVRSDDQEVFGQQLGVVVLPGDQRPQHLPAVHAVDHRRAAF